MKVRALRLGQRISLKKLQVNSKFKPSLRDPFVVNYEKDKHIVLFKYGTVIFWNFKDEEIEKIIAEIEPCISEKNSNMEFEDVDVNLSKTGENEISDGDIYISELDILHISLISIVLSRSLAMDRFEGEVGQALSDLEGVIDVFSKKGKSTLSMKALLKKLGFAMKIQHLAVNQMALLDRPNIAWENTNLDEFYTLLAEEYELEDRYEILDDKLNILFRSVEFILGYIETKKSYILEFTVVILILVEIIIFFFELFFLK